MKAEGIKENAAVRMQKAVEVLRKDLASLRAGRATPALLAKVSVNYYGVSTPVNQLANISAPEARLLVVQPWDRNLLPEIEKAILRSDLGVNPVSDGHVIRITIPSLTEERRKELVKTVRKRTEEARVAIRNIRREANEQIKALEKSGEVSADEARRKQEEVQKLTTEYSAQVEQIMAVKEAEIMKV